MISDDIGSNILAAWVAMSGWELLAVAFSLLYVWLAVREQIACWYAALISTAIFTALFWDVSLLMESALQIYYFAMAIYGWWHWKQGQQQSLSIHRWPLRWHLISISGLLLVSLLSGYLLSAHTTAALPYLDSLTTWASVYTTWLVARKVLENWLYWIVIDAISIYLYLDRGLYLSSLLMLLYVMFAIYGYLQWRAKLSEGDAGCAEPA